MGAAAARWLALVRGVFATIAFLIRQVGAVLPLIPLGALLLCHLRGKRCVLSWQHVLALLFPFLGIGATLWWIREIHGPTSVYLMKTVSIHYFFSVSAWLTARFWWIYFEGMVGVLVHLGFVLWPLALSSL